MDRRTLLRGAALAAGSAMAAGPFQGFFARAAAAAETWHSARPLSYGPLVARFDLRDGVVRLRLPRGFQYRSFDVTGDALTDGTTIPGRHDGMAAFGLPGGRTLLVRNHKVNGPVGAFGDPSTAYDPATGGGTTSVEVDAVGNVIRSYVSLNGTQMNCSGGPMPWGSWISCEETVNGPDVGPDFTGAPNDMLTQKHGYIFEVPADGKSSAEPIRSAGRFAHEAAAYDPGTKAVYLTEDNFGFPSGFYRYLPPVDPARARRLVDGGTLQMLAVVSQPQADLAGENEPPPAMGSVFDVEWVDIPQPDPDLDGSTNNRAISAVGDQGRALGGAIFSRLEGAAADRGTVYFCSTQGGAQPPGDSNPSGFGRGRGQIWAYHAPTSQLHLLYESPSSDVLDLPDNITTSRSGTLVLCEDGSDGNFVRGLTTDGRIFDFAQNFIAGRIDDGFAGATFGPDHQTLYVNIQASNGRTFAIWGPWGRGGF